MPKIDLLKSFQFKKQLLLLSFIFLLLVTIIILFIFFVNSKKTPVKSVAANNNIIEQTQQLALDKYSVLARTNNDLSEVYLTDKNLLKGSTLKISGLGYTPWDSDIQIIDLYNTYQNKQFILIGSKNSQNPLAIKYQMAFVNDKAELITKNIFTKFNDLAKKSSSNNIVSYTVGTWHEKDVFSTTIYLDDGTSYDLTINDKGEIVKGFEVSQTKSKDMPETASLGATFKYPDNWDLAVSALEDNFLGLAFKKNANTIGVVLNPLGRGAEGSISEDVTVAGVKGTKFTYKSGNNTKMILTGPFCNPNNQKKCYGITFEAAVDFNNNADALVEFNQVLSTFHFSN